MVGYHIPVLRKLHKGWKVELEEIFTVLSHSAVSNSLWPPWTVAHQAPLSMGIIQARILEWVAIPFSRGSSQPRDKTHVSHITGRFFTIWTTREPMNTGVGSLSLLQESSLTQESNWGLLHCRQILCQLSYQGSPWKCVTYLNFKYHINREDWSHTKLCSRYVWWHQKRLL